MNPPTDDRELDEYLSGRSEVSQRYRAAATEEPPAELDRAVLSQARAAVESPPSKVVRFPGSKTVRWIVPFAVAATVILTFSIVHQAGIEPIVTLDESEAPAAAPALESAPVAETESRSELDRSSLTADDKAANVLIESPVEPVKTKEEALERGRAFTAPQLLRKTQAVREAPQAAAPTAYIGGQEAARQKAITTTSTITPAAPPPAESKKDLAAEKLRVPEAWLEDIRKLRAAGQEVEAEAELKRFVETYPDYFQKNPKVIKP